MASRRAPATSVNPDAGSHPITGDPVELEAARRAAEESWSAFPYFEARYGERGRRFALSDAGWLVTLADRTKKEACEQVHWLSVVLASRGMPSIVLEDQLERLQLRLSEARPERRKAYDVLRACAAALRQQRRSRLSDARMREIAEMMPSQPVSGVGALIACAAADEANGIARAVSSMEEWLTSGPQFSSGWVASVRRTIAAARAAVTEPAKERGRSQRR